MIHKNRHRHAKRFTLTAIASAILTLHTQTASAVTPCPSQITGTALAGIVCQFNNTATSVTVANGGKVGGIVMSGYSPASSFININAGGTISNSTGNGITINSSTLTNGISNSGVISASGTGIAINSSSTISGGIINYGYISTTSLGIFIQDSTINGGINNIGKIISSSTGIKISASRINSGISNSGTITGSGVDSGVTIRNTTVNGNIVNSGTINSTTGNALLIESSNIIGGLTNSGKIVSTNSLGIDILNSSSIQNNITNSGTISGGQGGLFIHNGASIVGSVSNSGTVSSNKTGLAIYSLATISGSLSNSGTISGGTTGLAISSSSTINGGISNSGTIQGGTNGIYIDNSSTVNSINIIGQHARIIGKVNATASTFNVTSGAMFSSEGTIDVKTFNIASNATFTMANTITTTSGFNNAGTLTVGSTQTLNGNYTQDTGGIFQVGITNANNYGKLIVNGTADLSQNGNIYVNVKPNTTIHSGEVFNNVLLATTLTKPTNGYQVSGNSFLWNFTAMTNSGEDGINLIANLNPAATSVCKGSFCQDAANVIIGQIAAGNPKFNAYSGLASSSELQSAIIHATPELTNENIQVTQVVIRSVLDVIPMWGSLHGRSAGDAMLSEPGKVWIKPYAARIIQDQSNTVDGFYASGYGFVAGQDISMTENSMLGGALAFGKDKMRGKAQLSGQTINSDMYQAILYAAGKLSHNFFIAGQGLLGYSSNDTSRDIPLYMSTAQSSFHNWFSNLRAQLGWNAYALNQNLVLTPSVDASYLYITQSAYREHGSTMDLFVTSNNNSSLVLGAYGNVAYHLSAANKMEYLTITGYAGVARNVLNAQPETLAVFVAGGPNFATPGVQLNQTMFRGGVGLTIANPAKPLSVNLNYDAQTGNNAYSGVGSVTISYKL